MNAQFEKIRVTQRRLIADTMSSAMTAILVNWKLLLVCYLFSFTPLLFSAAFVPRDSHEPLVTFYSRFGLLLFLKFCIDLINNFVLITVIDRPWITLNKKFATASIKPFINLLQIRLLYYLSFTLIEGLGFFGAPLVIKKSPALTGNVFQWIIFFSLLAWGSYLNLFYFYAQLIVMLRSRTAGTVSAIAQARHLLKRHLPISTVVVLLISILELLPQFWKDHRANFVVIPIGAFMSYTWAFLISIFSWSVIYTLFCRLTNSVSDQENQKQEFAAKRKSSLAFKTAVASLIFFLILSAVLVPIIPFDRSALSRVAENGQNTYFKLFFKLVRNPEAVAKEESTIALKTGNTTIFKYIIQNIDLNKLRDSDGPLTWVYESDLPADKKLELAEYLISQFSREDWVKSALLSALNKNAPSIVQALFDKKLSYDTSFSYSLLSQALFRVNRVDHTIYYDDRMTWNPTRGGGEPLLEILLKNGILIDSRSNEMPHNTVLFDAVMNRDIQTVKLLLRHGANPTLKNDISMTPIEVTKYQVLRDIGKQKNISTEILDALNEYKKTR